MKNPPSSTLPNVPRRVTWLFRSGVLLLATSLIYSFTSFISSMDSTTDLTIYFMAGSAVHAGTNPYNVSLTSSYLGVGSVEWGYLYPPFLACVVSLLVPFGFGAVHTVWAAATTASILATAWMLRAVGSVGNLGVGWIALGLTFWPITIDGLERGQINAVVLGLLVAVLHGLMNNRPTLAGGALAVAVHLKVTPIILVVLLLHRSGAPARLPFVVTTAVVFLATWAVGGATVWSEFFSAGISTTEGGSAWVSPENLAISHILVMCFTGLSRIEAIWIQRLVIGVGVALVARRVLISSRIPLDQTFGLLTVLMFLASPLVWYHHAVWLIFAVVWCWRYHSTPVLRGLVLLVVAILSVYRFFEMAICSRLGWSQEVLLVEPLLFLIGVSILYYLLHLRMAINDKSTPLTTQGGRCSR